MGYVHVTCAPKEIRSAQFRQDQASDASLTIARQKHGVAMKVLKSFKVLLARCLVGPFDLLSKASLESFDCGQNGVLIHGSCSDWQRASKHATFAKWHEFDQHTHKYGYLPQ